MAVYPHTLTDAFERATAQEDAPAEMPRRLQIIPHPKQIRLPANLRIGKPRASCSPIQLEDDRFAAQDFIDDVQETAGLALKIGKGGGGRRGAILRGAVDLAPVRAALQRVGLTVPPDLDAEGYVLSAAGDEVVVAGRTPAGMFYGMQTLNNSCAARAARRNPRGADHRLADDALARRLR